MDEKPFSLPYKFTGGAFVENRKLQQLTKSLVSMSSGLFITFVLSTLGYLLWSTDLLHFRSQKSIFTPGDVLLGLVLACTVTAYYFFGKMHHNLEKQQHSMKTVSIATKAGIIALMPREEWGAEPPKHKLQVLQKPVGHVIISHSADIARLETTAACSEAARNLQQLGFHMGFDDIAFNYMVGNDGVVYEGRGKAYVSATAKEWNKTSIGIGFMGKFIDRLPSPEAIDACKAFLQYLVDEGVLSADFTVYGLCQVRPMFPDAPGAMLYKDIQTWKGTGKNNTWSWRPKEPSSDDKDTDVIVNQLKE